ncbi:hypothetical protein P3S68_004714 [Capsicum galapagoense]
MLTPISTSPYEESIIPEPAKATGKRKLPESEVYQLKREGKHLISESFELKPINVTTFSNLERGGTSENKLKKEDDYDYNHNLAIVKAIYHYYFNRGVIPHPPYSKNFTNYIEASVPNVKFCGQALANKIVILEHHFLKVVKMVARIRYYPKIIHPIFLKIFNLSMGLSG